MNKYKIKFSEDGFYYISDNIKYSAIFEKIIEGVYIGGQYQIFVGYPFDSEIPYVVIPELGEGEIFGEKYSGKKVKVVNDKLEIL